MSDRNHFARVELAHPKYRADIDGLRAVAVLSVVGYHAFPTRLTGGFIGVDIFFVISGFLISTIIFGNLQRGSFSFLEFYSRRIRRIFPALIIVLAGCLIAGWYVLFADEYGQLGKHVASGAGFVSNFTVWSESGYFDNAAITKPLLHLWSLGVEEQFYILWPVLLWATWKRKVNWQAVTVAIIALSFAFNLVEARKDAVADFYSPLTRFWELLIGAFLAHAITTKDAVLSVACGKLDAWLGSLLHAKCAAAAGNALRNVGALVGGALILVGLAIITNRRGYPSIWALFPTLGAACIIASGSDAWLNRKILASPGLVWFGLISYPLYLWHWPLLSFAQIVEGDTPSRNTRIAAIAISIALAWLTYAAIERPARFGGYLKAKTAILFAVMILAGGAGYAALASGGFSFRPIAQDAALLGAGPEEFPKDGYDCFTIETTYEIYERNGCNKVNFPNHKKVFLVGDSHSAYLSFSLKKYLRDKKLNFSQFSAARCTPLSLADRRKRCKDINGYVLQAIKKERPDVIVIFANYVVYSGEPDYGEPYPFDKHILQVTKDYAKLGIEKVVVIGQIPTWDGGLQNILLRRFVLRHKTIPDRTYNGVVPESLEMDRKLSRQEYPSNVSYVSLKNFLCNGAGCLTKVGPQKSDLIVRDYGHLTRQGADFLTENLLSKSIP